MWPRLEEKAPDIRPKRSSQGVVVQAVRTLGRLIHVASSRHGGGLHHGTSDMVEVSTRILGRRTAPFHLSLFLTASRMVLTQDPRNTDCT